MKYLATCLLGLTLVTGCSLRPASRVVRQDLVEKIDVIGRSALTEIAGLSIAVSKRNEPIITRTFGMADLKHNIPVTSATPFRIASASKQFVAFSIMQLVDEKRLDLDANLATYLPDFPLHGYHLTLRQLLSHTAGIPEHVGDPATDREFAKYAHGVPLDVTIATFSSRPFDFRPGTRWSYSNSGYVLLVKVIERVTGMPYWEYMRLNIFEPLGLTRTQECDVNPPPKGLAEGYTRNKGTFATRPPHIPGTMAGGGFVCATASDLARWQRALHKSLYGRMMSRATVLLDQTTIPYGFAVSLSDIDGHMMLGHGGVDVGFRASVNYFPSDDVTVIVLANTDSDVTFDVAYSIARAASGLPKSNVLELPVEDATLRAIQGTFEIARGWEWTVTVEGARATARSGDSELISLVYQGNGVFLSSSHPSYRFVFTIDHGVANTVSIDQFGMRFLAQRSSRDELVK